MSKNKQEQCMMRDDNIYKKSKKEFVIPMATKMFSKFPDISLSMLCCRVFPVRFLYSTRAFKFRKGKKKAIEKPIWLKLACFHYHLVEDSKSHFKTAL